MSGSGNFRIKIFADGADVGFMLRARQEGLVSGFTTNPTLMRKAGVASYEAFAREVLAAIPDAPVSFEVFSDELDGMERQARKIAAWADNVYVKIPVTNTRRESTAELVRRLSGDGVKLNVTALLTTRQVGEVVEALDAETPSIVSVFAGRIADTGCDPVPLMQEALKLVRRRKKAELLWASPREVLNVYQAEAIGCHIITATSDVLAKLKLRGRDLDEYSLDTVRMFYEDARAAGYEL
jgi:transaldolase